MENTSLGLWVMLVIVMLTINVLWWWFMFTIARGIIRWAKKQ